MSSPLVDARIPLQPMRTLFQSSSDPENIIEGRWGQHLTFGWGLGQRRGPSLDLDKLCWGGTAGVGAWCGEDYRTGQNWELEITSNQSVSTINMVSIWLPCDLGKVRQGVT